MGNPVGFKPDYSLSPFQFLIKQRIAGHGGCDWTVRFPAIADDARRLAVKTAILDGEAVVLDDRGRSDFGMLQRALGRLPCAVEAGAIVLYGLRSPLSRRPRSAPAAAARAPTAARADRRRPGRGNSAFRRSAGRRRRVPPRRLRTRTRRHYRQASRKTYRSGRNDCVGFEPSTVPGAIGRLLLAARKGDELVYVGGCGTGWSRQESVKLRELLDEIVTKTPAVVLKRKNAVFTRPVLVAEVEYRTWTDDGKLPLPSFKGISEWEDDAAIFKLH